MTLAWFEKHPTLDAYRVGSHYTPPTGDEMHNPFTNELYEREERNRKKESMLRESVNHPQHYTNHPSGIECIQITEHMGFNLGNCLKYVGRADLKGNAIEDLEKARWYIDRELAKRRNQST